ncbi:MAG: recombinase family protein [Candidatus Competibacteraceae bacterium]
MRIGYARVSTDDQSLGLQQDALRQAGCERIYQEKVSGARAERAELARLLEALRPGDTLVVWRLDRLGRSLKHLIETVEHLDALGVGFQSLTETIDTTTSGGKLVFHLFAALAEFERTLIRERTRAGLQAARSRGRQGGRPRALDEPKRRMAQALRDDPAQNIAAICATLGISRTTFYRYTQGKKR